MAFSFVGLFEFLNGYAKFSRTRYLIFYFFYYLENASMMGAWYVYFTFPEMWYYLPSLLVITVVQLLGFILLQLYLYFFSKPRRKTTLCGFCFAHRMDTDAEAVGDLANRASDLVNRASELDHRPPSQLSKQRPLEFTATGIDGSSRTGRPLGSQLSISGHQLLPSMWSVGASGSQSAWTKRNAGGLCDPVFGQQIAQSARPLQRPPESSRRVPGQQHKMRQRPRATVAPSNLLQLPKAADPSRHETWLASQACDTKKRASIQPGAVPASERNWYQQRSLEDLPFEACLGRESSVGNVPTIISAEEALEQELSSSYQSSRRANHHGNSQPERRRRKMVVNAYETMASNYNDDDEQPGEQNTGQSGVPSSRLRGRERHSAAVASALPAEQDRNYSQPQKPQRGVFQPAPNQYRKKWPYATPK